jgi:hypothetical protein
LDFLNKIFEDAWITNAGVVKEVGQAIENYRYRINRQTFDIPIIGITSEYSFTLTIFN